jgi:poly-gamma-glutamate capsule biosynthesis protein CapA/YwtB (metallophosphatase superfamily)
MTQRDHKRDRSLQLLVAGDVQPHRKNPETLFAAVSEYLRPADLRVCQLECVISDKGVVRTDVRNPAHRVPPENIEALTSGGFNVITFAGNNNLDYGTEAFTDTIQRLRERDIVVVGAGKDLREATAPVVVERNGLRVGFVNFCSILRDGYAATSSRAGISPLRVRTFYEPLENIYEQPGTPSRTVTIADSDDLDSAMTAVRQAKESADIVVAAFHWGVHFTHDLATYQADVGYAAIDNGADLVIGGHPHCLQAIDVHNGKFIFYSLGNFAFEQDAIAHHGVGEYLSFYGLPIDSTGVNPHPVHSRMSCLLSCTLSGGGITDLRITPTYFTDGHQPEVQLTGAPKYEEIASLLERLSAEIGTSIKRNPDGTLSVEPEKRVPLDTRDLLRRRKLSYPHLGRLVALGGDTARA